jgi:hypothetical protein
VARRMEHVRFRLGKSSCRRIEMGERKHMVVVTPHDQNRDGGDCCRFSCHFDLPHSLVTRNSVRIRPFF